MIIYLYTGNYNSSLQPPSEGDALPIWNLNEATHPFTQWSQQPSAQRAINDPTFFTTAAGGQNLHCLTVYRNPPPRNALQVADETIQKIREYDYYFMQFARVSKMGLDTTDYHSVDNMPYNPPEWAPPNPRTAHMAGELTARYTPGHNPFHPPPHLGPPLPTLPLGTLTPRPAHKHIVVYRGITADFMLSEKVILVHQAHMVHGLL